MREAEPRGRDECCARQLRGPALSSLGPGLQNARLEARNAP